MVSGVRITPVVIDGHSRINHAALVSLRFLQQGCWAWRGPAINRITAATVVLVGQHAICEQRQDPIDNDFCWTEVFETYLDGGRLANIH